jgi:hypothetical protein
MKKAKLVVYAIFLVRPDGTRRALYLLEARTATVAENIAIKSLGRELADAKKTPEGRAKYKAIIKRYGGAPDLIALPALCLKERSDSDQIFPLWDRFFADKKKQMEELREYAKAYAAKNANPTQETPRPAVSTPAAAPNIQTSISRPYTAGLFGDTPVQLQFNY